LEENILKETAFSLLKKNVFIKEKIIFSVQKELRLTGVVFRISIQLGECFDFFSKRQQYKKVAID
jgi:hypothetical protein